LIYYDCREVTPFRLKGRIYFEIWDALAEADIEIPFPQRDLHVRSADIMPELKDMMEAKRAQLADDESEAKIESLEEAVERTAKEEEQQEDTSDAEQEDDEDT
jgi:hypothetical protein